MKSINYLRLIALYQYHEICSANFFGNYRLIDLVKSNLIFTIGMPGNLNESKKLINEHGSDLYKSAFSIDYPDTFGKIIDY